jgi:hypothetical protein
MAKDHIWEGILPAGLLSPSSSHGYGQDPAAGPHYRTKMGLLVSMNKNIDTGADGRLESLPTSVAAWHNMNNKKKIDNKQ